jgi:hypothetical protein
LRKKEYPVGICCSPAAWRSLTNGAEQVQATVESADDPQTKIWGIGGTEEDGIEIANFHYLFMIYGSGNATVRIKFPHPPPIGEEGRVIVKRSPSQSF